MMGLRAAFLSAAIVLFLQSSATADAPSQFPLPRGIDTIVVPSGSPVRFASMDEHGRASFKGRFVLSGTYYYGDNEYSDGPDVYLTLYFVPDPDIAARLPYFKIRGRPSVIFLNNSDTFVNAVVSRQTLARLQKKGAPRAAGKIAIWADGFEARIECDAAEFRSRFVSIYKPARALVAANKQDFDC